MEKPTATGMNNTLLSMLLWWFNSFQKTMSGIVEMEEEKTLFEYSIRVSLLNKDCYLALCMKEQEDVEEITNKYTALLSNTKSSFVYDCTFSSLFPQNFQIFARLWCGKTITLCV